MIRKARKEEAEALSEISYLVINDFFEQLANTQNEEQLQKDLLKTYIESETSSFSYRNIYVAERDGEIAGAMWLYDYDEQEEKYQTSEDFEENPDSPLLTFVDETLEEAKPGDLYLDTIAVSEEYQGQGVASELLNYAKELSKKLDNHQLSLIVDKENPHAEKVYLRHGFETQESNEMYGSIYKYMRYTK